MIYLEREEVEFTKTQVEFKGAYTYLLEEMFNTFERKGKVRDVDSPIHHRMSPLAMLSIGQAKMRRIESILSFEGWELNEKHLADLIEECTDVGNYVLYIAALCQMLKKESKR